MNSNELSLKETGFTLRETSLACMLDLANDKKLNSFWRIQKQLTLDLREMAYPILVEDAMINKDESEETFIKRALETYYSFIDCSGEEIKSNPLADYNIKKYIDFLLERKTILNRKDLNFSKKTAFTLSRIDTISLIILLAERGCFGQSFNDYSLAKLIENNYLYEGNKPFKHVRQEISKFRRFERDPKQYEERIKALLLRARIKTNDDLDN